MEDKKDVIVDYIKYIKKNKSLIPDLAPSQVYNYYNRSVEMYTILNKIISKIEEIYQTSFENFIKDKTLIVVGDGAICTITYLLNTIYNINNFYTIDPLINTKIASFLKKKNIKVFCNRFNEVVQYNTFEKQDVIIFNIHSHCDLNDLFWKSYKSLYIFNKNCCGLKSSLDTDFKSYNLQLPFKDDFRHLEIYTRNIK